MKSRTRSKESTETTKPETSTDWELIEELLDLDELRTMLLHGRSGTGKTYVAMFKGKPAEYVVTLTPETCAAELRGTWIPRGQEFEWHDGPFTAAMRHGARVVANEISHASDDVLALFYPVLEHAETARLTLPTRETITAAPGFQLIATDNREPEELPAALRDRFEFVQPVNHPHPDALERLSEPLRRAALRCCVLEDERAISIRSWLVLDRLQQKFGMEKAARAVFGPERGVQVVDGLALAQESMGF